MIIFCSHEALYPRLVNDYTSMFYRSSRLQIYIYFFNLFSSCLTCFYLHPSATVSHHYLTSRTQFLHFRIKWIVWSFGGFFFFFICFVVTTCGHPRGRIRWMQVIASLDSLNDRLSYVIKIFIEDNNLLSVSFQINIEHF